MEDKYTLKIPIELKDLFQKYIERNPSLGFKKVSRYILHLLQNEANRILNNNPELDDYIKVDKFTYIRRSALPEYKRGELTSNWQSFKVNFKTGEITKIEEEIDLNKK